MTPNKFFLFFVFLISIACVIAAPLSETTSNLSTEINNGTINDTTNLDDNQDDVKITCNSDLWINSDYCKTFCTEKYNDYNDCTREPWSKHLCCVQYYKSPEDIQKELMEKIEDNQKDEIDPYEAQFLDSNINKRRDEQMADNPTPQDVLNKLKNDTGAVTQAAAGGFFAENIKGILLLVGIIIFIVAIVFLIKKFLREKKARAVILAADPKQMEVLVPYLKKAKEMGWKPKDITKYLVDAKWDETLVTSVVYRLYTKWKMLKIKY